MATPMKIHGMPIVDGRKKLAVTIRPSDVSRAGVQNPAKCAVAQAICRQDGMAEARVHISRTYVRQDGAKRWERYATPLALRTEIIAFDKGAPKAFDVPQTFMLAPTQPSMRLTGKRQGGHAEPKGRKRGPKERRSYILTHIRPNANAEFDRAT